MAFTAIEQTPGLSAAQRRRAAEAGPPDVLVRTSYESLLRSAGFSEVTVDDLTAEYRDTLSRWATAHEANADGVAAAMGPADAAERLANRYRTMAAVDDGLLRRSLYVATRPSPRRGGS